MCTQPALWFQLTTTEESYLSSVNSLILSHPHSEILQMLSGFINEAWLNLSLKDSFAWTYISLILALPHLSFWLSIIQMSISTVLFVVRWKWMVPEACRIIHTMGHLNSRGTQRLAHEVGQEQRLSIGHYCTWYMWCLWVVLYANEAKYPWNGVGGFTGTGSVCWSKTWHPEWSALESHGFCNVCTHVKQTCLMYCS